MKESAIRIPHPNPTTDEVIPVFTKAGFCRVFTQLTITTGAVWRFVTTANVAPVSLILLVKTIMAPERIEYFVKGNIIVLNTPKGLAPSVLAASSMSRLILSNAADIDLTKYG